MAPTQPVVLWISRRIIAATSRLVPQAARVRWIDEWHAELGHAARRDPAIGSTRLLRRSLSAWRDALAVRHAVSTDASSAPPQGSTRNRITHDFASDLRHAFRGLRRQPGFAVLALVTIAVGIGANATIFSLVRGIVLRPLPYVESNRLVAVWPDWWHSKRMVDLLREHATSYDAIAAWGESGESLVDEDGAELVYGPKVTAGFFEALGAAPILGRTFAAEDEIPGANTVILSEEMWRGRFGGDPDIIGRTLEMRGVTRTVIGVMPAGLDYLQDAAVISLPETMDPSDPLYEAHYLHVVARLKPGVTLEQATAEYRALTAGWREELERSRTWGSTATVAPLQDYVVGDFDRSLYLMLGAVGLTLLIAAANVANILLAKALSRQRELSLRIALGARPWRLIRQMLTESTLLGLLGGAAGMAAAAAGVRAMRAILPEGTPRLDEVAIDGTVLAAMIGMSVFVGWIVGLVPALHAGRTDPREGLGAGVRASASRGRRRIRNTLVSAEVALAVVLLTGAGLLLSSFANVQRVNLGFEPEGLLAFSVSPDARQFSDLDGAQTYYRNLAEQVEAIPGVTRAAAIHAVPVQNSGWNFVFYEEGSPPAPGDNPLIAWWRATDPGYFETAGMSMLRGRTFTERDGEHTQPVAVVPQATSRFLFGDADPIGRRIVIPFEGQTPITIVGVLADAQITNLDEDAPLTVYRPYAQGGAALLRLGVLGRSFVVRAAVNPSTLERAVREAVRSVDPAAPVYQLESMPDILSQSLAARRAVVVVLAAFALMALLLGTIGMYGVMSHAARERLRDMSIRRALGATSQRVVGEILGDGLRLTGIGLLAGVGLSLALSQYVRGMLFGVTTTDWRVLATVAGTLVAAAIVASLGPASRAAHADPMHVLREE